MAFAEARFAKPEGYGVLFTNGTGTGKTYTGLGIAYRYERQGKGNILITAPTQKVIEDWVRSGKNLGLDIKALDSTSDNGKSGIVITTYANLGANDTLGRRDWDLVITDEAHYLMQEKDGNPTGFLHNLRAISMHPRGRYRLAEMRYHKEFAAFKTAMEAMDRANKEKRSGAATDALKASLNAARKAWTEAQDKTKALVESRQGRDRTRVVFLSATPFAYEKNVDYAEGYLFSYEAENTSAGYNHGSPFDRFMMQHFGYSMRTNKLTAPGPEVDSGLMQRQFNTWLKREKVLSGRMLDVKPDYDRKFVLVDSAIGRRIDEALDWLRAEGETDRAQIAGRQELHKIVASQFDYLQRRFLLEAIKAQDVIPVIKAHQALGRKVVVFHDYKKGGGFHPFKLQIPKGLEVHYSDPNSPTRGGSVKIEPIYEDFKRVFKDLISHPFEKMDSPIEALGRAFPNAQFFNGDAPIAKRKEAVSRFQADGSPYNLIVVQSAAGKEGISLHDTTGQHQRVLINLGLPTQPTTAIQQEGRIYRTGQMTDALMRYLNTGTAWERQAFANTIARRASTAENLAQGEGARALLDSFIQSFEESDTYEPGHDGEGKGGKARDKAMQQMLSEFDRAKTYYFSQQKKNSRTKSQEGNDYFATPEPVGLKMVEFLRLRGGEHSLEPSAGHGAIARWLPDNTRRRAIEQSRELATRLALAFDGEIVTGQFEDHNIVNKYDGIVMNPPFGMGGSMAFPHLEKAWRHLRDGGRIVALLPAGGMADKRLEKFLYEEDEKGKPTRPDMELVANILLPGVTFNRAGTGVMTRIIVLQRGEFDGQTIQRDYTDVEDIKDLFDRIENLDMPERPETAQTGPVGASPAVGNASPAALPATGYAQPGAAGDTFEAFNQKHSQTGADMFMAKFTARVEYAEYSAAAAIAKKHGGSWSKYANKAAGIRAGFAFKTAAARDAFVAEASQSAQNQVREPEAAYTVDLFGEPFELAAVPNAPRAGGNRPRRPAAPAGDVQPAGALQDTPAPAGQYFANTSIVKTVDRELGATRIRSAEDLAAATAYLYRSAVERFDAIVTDRGGKPLAVVGSFKGALTQTSVYPATLVAEAVRVPGAANIWFSHNHPSGTATLSPADRALHEVMVNAFNGSGIKPRDLIAVAGKNFAARFADTRNDIGDMSIPASTGSVTVPAIEREINVNEDPTRNESVTSPGMAKDAARRFYLQKGEPGVMLTDARNRVVAWVPIAPALAGALRGTGGLNAVYRAISQANAASAIMVHGGEYSASVNGVKIFQNIGAALKLVDVQPLDAINVRGPNGGAVSAAEQFQNLDAGPVFSRGDGPLKRPPMPAAAGLDVNAAREIADGLTAGWENAPPITVLATPADAPFDAPDDANGALYRGQVYLFASNLRTAADVQFTLFHETLGHTGLRGMLGAGMDAELRRIANLNAGVRKAAAIWSERFGRDAIQQRVESGMSRADARAVVRLLAIEEALADMAGSGKPITGLQRFMAKVQELLRAIGFERVADWLENATDAEVASLLAKARAWVEGDTHTTTAEELAATFSRDIAPAGAERIFYADTMEEQETRRVSAMRELRKLRKRLEDGDIDEADFVERTQALLDRLEEQAANKSGAFRNRVRGADWLRERLIRARRTGEVSIDTINLGLWLIEKNPEIVERLGISIRAQGPGEKGNAGMYDPFTRVLTLFKEGDKADTAVHEILHHTERMMPPAVQRAISKEWTKHLAEAMKDAIGELDPVRFDLLEQMLSATLGDRAAVKAVREAFDDGTLEYNDYQLYSPSEFWAVNGARILTARAEAEGSWIAQARQWLREFVQYIKGLLKLPSDSPVLKGLTNILNSNGEELSPNVLALAFDHLMSLQEADLLSAYDEAALKEKTDREEAARKAEEKARADALKPPARRVRAEQVDMFNNQQALFSRTAKTSIEANIARGRKAMNKALLDKADVNRAMWRSDLGWIDFPWGDAKKGVAHILERRQSQDGLTERAATKLLTEDLVDVIASGTTIRRTDIERASRLVIRKGAVEAILTRNNSTNGWLLSGYEIKKGGEKAAGDGAAKSTLDTPTRFRGAEGAPSGSLDDRGAGFDASAPTRSTSTPTRRGAGAGEDGSVSDGPLFNRAQAAQDAATAPAGLRARARRAIERVDALVNPLGNLPAKRAYKAERYQVLGRIARVDEIAGNIGKVFKNATEADRTAAYEYLTTAEASPLTIVGEETRRETMALKRLIGSVGDALVARGLLSEEAREEYRDRYLPRLYLKHVLGESDYRALGGGKKVSDMGYLKARRDIPEEIRQVILGEITDPGFLAATGVAKPMRDMALLDWLASIAGNIEWVDRGTVVDWLGMTVSVRWLQLEAARLRKQAAYYTPDNAAKALAMAKDMDAAVDAATDGQAPDPTLYKQIPDSARYGRLRGMWVRTEIYDDMMGVADFLPQDAGWWQSLLGYGGIGTRITQLWKMSKVALNPPGQVRNFVSNMVMLQLSGVPLHRLPDTMIRAARQIISDGPMYKVAKKYGVTAATFSTQELGRIRTDLLNLEIRTKGLHPLKRMAMIFGVITNAASEMYQFTETMFKTAKIMDGIQRQNLSEADAAIEAHDWLFDYSLVSQNVRYMRNAPIGVPFVTYFTKVLPRLLEAALLHPQRLLPWVGLYYALPALAASAFGVDDDDLDKLKKALPEWLQKRGNAFFLPYKDELGRVQAVDLGYFFPWGQWQELGGALLDTGKSLADGKSATAGLSDAMRAAGLFSGPVTDIIVALKTNEDSFTGRDIINKADPPARQWAALANYVWDMAMPPFIGSRGILSPMGLIDEQYGGKAVQAALGTTNKFGEPRNTAAQAALALIGVNMYAVDPDYTRADNMLRMQREMEDVKQRLEQQLADRGLSEERRQKLVRDYVEEIGRRQQDMLEYIDKSEVHPNLKAGQR